jgi:monoamine oxidase
MTGLIQRTKLRFSVRSKFSCRIEVLEVDAEGWNVDPYSNGSWSTYRIEQMEFLGGMRKLEGRLTFAGSEICRGSLTWIDGAVESGTYSAAELDRILTRD